MTQALAAGMAYWAIVFAAGFGLGIARTLFVEERLGKTWAVAAELPLMLAASWFACRFVLQRFALLANVSSRCIMGAFALALLLVAEALVSVGLGGRTLAQHVALYATTPAQLGLAAQVLFAAFPLVQRRTRRAPMHHG